MCEVCEDGCPGCTKALDGALYAGGRLGLLLSTRSFDAGEFGDDEESRTDFFLGPVIGGEHF